LTSAITIKQFGFIISESLVLKDWFEFGLGYFDGGRRVVLEFSNIEENKIMCHKRKRK